MTYYTTFYRQSKLLESVVWLGEVLYFRDYDFATSQSSSIFPLEIATLIRFDYISFETMCLCGISGLISAACVRQRRALTLRDRHLNYLKF